MIARVRASLAAALVLLVACSAPAAAQQRECSAADSARVGWSPPPGVADDAWLASLLADSLVAPGTELVRIAYDSLHSLGGDFSLMSQLIRELDEVIRARIGDGPVKVVVLARIEPDSTMSRLLLAQWSGGRVGIEESVRETIRRVRVAPAFRDGCPMAIWYPMIVEIFPPQRIEAAAAQPARPSHAQAVMVGSFEVWVVRDYFTGEDRSNAFITARGAGWGQLMWKCADGGGLWVGVTLPGQRGRDGETRPVEWRFDGDTPATASLLGVRDFLRWFLPAEDVARFTVRARTARSLVIRLPDDGTEYVYELEQPRQALDRLACARGTPVAGRIPQPTPEFSGVGVETPRNEGTYELPAWLQSPGDRWVKVFQNAGEAVWIDTISVRRVREDVFQFTLRHTYAVAARRPSDGMTFDGTDDVMEFDCARGRSRTLRTQVLLGERVVEEREAEVPARNWTRSLPRQDAYCPVLRQARPRSPLTPPDQ